MNRSRTWRAPGLIAASMLALLATAPPVAASSQDLRWGISRPATSSPSGGGGCVATAQVWVQELGQSGVTRFRAGFKLHAPYVQLYTSPIPSFRSEGAYYSGSFPNDTQSYHWYVNSRMNHLPGNDYGYWTKLVGERPGLWRPDRTITYRLGQTQCSTSASSPSL